MCEYLQEILIPALATNVRSIVSIFSFQALHRVLVVVISAFFVHLKAANGDK